MRCLFLDLASCQPTVAVVAAAEVLSMRTLERALRDDELAGTVEDLLKEAHARYPHLTHVACVSGPGGFTSLRVGVTFANVLSDDLGVPLAAVPLVDVYAARCEDEDAVWVHSTKKAEVFIRSVTDRCITWSWPEPTHTTLQEALDGTPEVLRWCGELIPEHRSAFEARGMREAPLVSLRSALPGLVSRAAYTKGQIAPWYGRHW